MKKSLKIVVIALLLITIAVITDLFRGGAGEYSVIEDLACTIFTSGDYVYASGEHCVPVSSSDQLNDYVCAVRECG